MAEEDREALSGRVVLVTGSGRGLGAAIAQAAARRGAHVVVNCRSNLAAAEALALETCARNGTRALAHKADVSDPEAARGLVEKTAAAFGRIDVLVNAVGSFAWKAVAETDPTEWRTILASNLDSVYHMSRLVLPHMRGAHWGRIVSLGAVGAERTLGQPKVAAYSAAKAAVVAFSKALALEEARSGITVNVVSPCSLIEDGAPSTHEAQAYDIAGRVPVGRPGAAADVARAVLFFATPAADYVTGQVLSVAGGWQL